MKNDLVDRPEHYTHRDDFETIDALAAFVEHFPSFVLGNILKYLTRHKRKNGVEDLRKARRYLDLLIEIENGDDRNPSEIWKSVDAAKQRGN